MRKHLKRLLIILAFIFAFMALAEPIKTRADFGNFAGNSDYGGGTSGGSHGGGGFISDLETEALSWVIAIALVIIMIIYYALIKPIIDKIRGKNPEDHIYYDVII